MFLSKRGKTAFTLIELMIVITIIGILTTISITSFQSSQRRSRDVVRKSQVLKVQSAIEQYKSANNVYAPDYASVAAGLAASCTALLGQLGGTYVVSTQASATRDPAFVQDATNAATIAMTPYLTKYTDRPSYITSSIKDPAYDSDVIASCDSSGILVKTSRIAYEADSNQYWVYVALENKNDPRAPLSNVNCYHANSAAVIFHDAEFPAFKNYPTVNCDNSQYKIFARGSLSQPYQ